VVPHTKASHTTVAVMKTSSKIKSKCSVPLCTSKGMGGFHNFPVYLKFRANWQNICQLSKVRAKDRVCQRHFDKSDYTTPPGSFTHSTLTNQPLLPLKPRLKTGAYPSLHVPKNESTNDLSDSNSSMDPPTFVEENVIAPDKIHCSMPQCKTKGPRVEFLTFPTKNSDHMAKWQNICHLSKVYSSSRLCQHHFDKSDYFITPGTLNELKLKTGAFPVLHVPTNHFKSSILNDRRKCSVPLCTTKGDGGVLHIVPLNPDLRAKWRNICQLPEQKTSASYVCQRHFDKSDYLIAPGTLNNLNEEIKPRLNNGACPSLHVPKNESTNDFSVFDSSVEQQALVVIEVEENVIVTPETIHHFHLPKKPSKSAPTLSARFKCSVPLCTTKGDGGGFHRFPANPNLMAKWRNICQLPELKSSKKKYVKNYVCQRHFEKSDYVIAPGTLNDLNEEMKPRLNNKACPSLHVPKNESTNDFSVSDSSVEQQTFVTPETINDLNEDIKPSLKIGAFPVVLHVPNECIDDCDSSMDPLKFLTEKSNKKSATKVMAIHRRKCSVPLCTTKGIDGFHKFPVYPEIKAKWQNICQLSKVRAKDCVCQRHFDKSDYTTPPGRFNDLKRPLNPRLKTGACPSLHVPKHEETNYLPDSNSSKAPPTFVTKDEKKNVIAQDTIHCSMPQCKTKGPRVEFHTFPTKNSDHMAKWQKICHLSKVYSSSRLCRRHFDKSDYFIAPGTLNDLKLKTGAFPVLHVPKKHIKPSTLNDRRKCSVSLCTTKGDGGVLHIIPLNPDLRAKWRNICQLPELKTTPSYVCQRHFDKCDYVIPPGTLNDLNEEIKPRLNNGACPSLHIPQKINESTNDLSHYDSSMQLPTFVVKVEENVIAPQDTINVFYEDIKPSFKIGAFPAVLHMPNESTNDLSDDSNSCMDPLAVTVKMEH
jgi:hypothetical protein